MVHHTQTPLQKLKLYRCKTKHELACLLAMNKRKIDVGTMSGHATNKNEDKTLKNVI